MPINAITQPLDYIAAVMDEETRPLLASYIKTLGDKEAVLVVYRQAQGANSDVLLESSIQQISEGHSWDFVSGGTGNSKLQVLVNELADIVNESRVANAMFAQGGAKIKAFDTHKITFGIIGNGRSIPAVIKGIVHQQINMGLNGDLVLHENNIIFGALLKCGVLHDAANRARPIKIKTYGAGGASSKSIHPGDMQTSDLVIDLRTHIYPACILEFFKAYITGHPKERSFNAKHLQAFQEQVALIEDKMGLTAFNNDLARRQKDNNATAYERYITSTYDISVSQLHRMHSFSDYTGMQMVHDVAILGQKIAQCIGESISEIMQAMPKEAKQYYGEITLTTPNSGTDVIKRILFDADFKAFFGDTGQQEAINALQHFLINMSDTNKEVVFQKKLSPLEEKLQELDVAIALKTQALRALLQANILEQYKAEYSSIQSQIHTLKYSEKTNDLCYLDEILLPLRARVVEIEQHSYNRLKQPTATEYKHLLDIEAQLSYLAGKFQAIEQQIIHLRNEYLQYVQADAKLKYLIKKYKRLYETLCHAPLGITASGNIFFTMQDKQAVSHYGAKMVEMENQLFMQVIQYNVANGIYIDKECVTKIAADPFHINDAITQTLNDWANSYVMSLDDYVAAFMWAYNGQKFSSTDFPDCGRWQIAEKLYQANQKNTLKFYNFGTKEEPKIINPFWKEVGTDLVMEIYNGKAFIAGAFARMNFDEEPLLQRKEDLQALAGELLYNTEQNVEIVQQKARELFAEYLLTMAPLHTDKEGMYKVYARYSMVLPKGYVEGRIKDWDQFLYKSTNTAVLAQKAADFIAKDAGKCIGAGKALMRKTAADSLKFPVQFFSICDATSANDKDDAVTLLKTEP